MKCVSDMMKLYAVTDRSWTKNKTLKMQVEDALKGGVTCVQLREKMLSDEEFFEEAIEIKKLCSSYNVPFIINDNVDIAVKSNADGIHVGQNDMEAQNVRQLIGDSMMLGVSVQTVEQAVDAEKNGADYLGVGAMFNTTTKDNAIDVTYDTLREICKSVTIPVVAIGGINKDNMYKLAGAGIDGVALVSAIFAADDIEAECKLFRSMSDKICEDK